MALELKVGDSAVVVSYAHRTYECYDVKIEKISPTGQLTVSFTTRGTGYHITKRFYPVKHCKDYYREVGASGGYYAVRYDIYFGARAEKERQSVLEWREQQSIWDGMDKALTNMPTRWHKEVPTNEQIADVRSKIAVLIEVLNRAEKWQHEQAIRAADEERAAGWPVCADSEAV